MPFYDNPAVLAAIVTVIGTFFVGVAVALYGPYISNWAARRRLRVGLYRELVNWYELIVSSIKAHERESEEKHFFKPWYPGIMPADEAGITNIIIGNSIVQAEINPQIWRRDLRWKLTVLRTIFSQLNEQLSKANSLYYKMLGNVDDLQRFYQLKEGSAISERYNALTSALAYQLSPSDLIPSSSKLTDEEARELCTLEAQLDSLKIACRTVEQAEEDEEIEALDGCLLYKIREGKPRGTMMHPAGEASETDRWCHSCKKYSTPVKVRSIQVLHRIPLVSDYHYVFWRMNKSLRFTAQRELLRKGIQRFDKTFGESWLLRQMRTLLQSALDDQKALRVTLIKHTRRTPQACACSQRSRNDLQI